LRRIISKKEFAERMSRSVRHLERMIAAGEGPPIIKLGPRAVGIAEDDGEAWLGSPRVASPRRDGSTRRLRLEEWPTKMR
jgi:predicted DNA-binding transcriptional regulator AlpA